MHTVPGNQAGLRGYWRLDEGFGGTAFDSAPRGGNSNGTLHGGPTWALKQPCH